MEPAAREQREIELVQLMLGDRAGFRAECRRALNLQPGDRLPQPDRDLIRAVLDLEFPPLTVRWHLPESRQKPRLL